MKIISIDASTKSCGIAIFDNEELIQYDCITASSTNLIKRIYKVVEGIENILKECPVEVLILEEVRPQNNQYGAGNIQTHRALMFLQAAINFMIYDKFSNIKIEYLYPSEWRKYCGIKQGQGVRREQLKQEDIEWVKNKYKVDVNDDIADAIGIGYGYLQQNKGKKELNWE